MKKTLFLFLLFCFPNVFLIAQVEKTKINGTVYEIQNEIEIPLIGVNVYWSGTTIGVVTGTDGRFSIERTKNSNQLVFSYAGYQPDTLIIQNKLAEGIKVVLSGAIELEGVEIVKRQKTMEFSMIQPIKVEKIGESELQKAACCNLSESFETNPSVDVSFTDAITGTKQIQMLGLAGSYTQITRENIPDVRGLSSVFGMEYTPGPWIESIQLNKGTGSVVNGFESIAGQINVELRKPFDSDRIYFNLFANQESRVEANLNLTQKVNDKFSTTLLLHGRNSSLAMDNNADGFIDKPIGNQIIVLNRWQFIGTESGWSSQMGIKATVNTGVGGENGFPDSKESGLWGYESDTRRLEGWAKAGKISNSKPYQSFGFQFSGLLHEQESDFGMKNYVGDQRSFYGNFIFQSAFKTTLHKYRTGASFQYDDFDEKLDSFNFIRKEMVPGLFFEYTWSPKPNFDLVAGIRGDYHNNYGLFFTPRLHLRYAPFEKTVIRLSAGSGQRTPSILAENISVLASARVLTIQSEANSRPYGLNAEKAWNFGANLTQKFKLDYRDGAVSFDFYQTRFVNQVVVDLDENPQQINFYNLNGESYSTSFQTQIDYELIRRLDVRLAYRWYDVKTQYRTGVLSKPLVSANRAFLNLAYETMKKWKFDYTLQWFGPKRIPNTESNPIQYRLPDYSPQFLLMNTQVSKTWRGKFDIYVGAENLLDYKQNDPIISREDPFSPYFDSSLIWGPVFGRMIYGGLRLKIK
ncbi:MAG: TonB-dependent receptor [Bacteroidales bacterium]|nr:TonB-dependent receptor [Bacteroidales bacterium]MBN2821535.1 TonB-dependent receptor [Bacteroidales bacterium]